MLCARLADLVLIIHLVFVAFVVLGGLLVLRWPVWSTLHVPSALWGVFVEWSGWTCPLTPLENAWRRCGSQAGHSGGFLDHHVSALLYPSGLTRGSQIALGALVLVVNGIVYPLALARHRRRIATTRSKGRRFPSFRSAEVRRTIDEA
jgi:hypothetical protein